MDINYYVSLAINFLQTNKIIALVIVLALVLFVWKKPGAAMRFGIFLGIMAVVFYLITLMNDLMFEGADYTNEMDTKSIQQIQE